MTARHALPLAAALAALALAGCGSGDPAVTLTPDQRQARETLLERHAGWSDRELAKLCPGLYPRDFLTNEDDYPEPRGEDDRTPKKITEQDREQAQAAACDVRPG
jgi:hypothetical protein